MEIVHTIHLLEELDQMLIDLLSSLSEKKWQSKTSSSSWTVKDIAVHLLDGNLRTLSMLRDGFYGEFPENGKTYDGMVQFLNRLNSDWTVAMKRLSPQVIIDLLKSSGKEYREYLYSLEMDDTAVFAVQWMGNEETLNWMHIAREYTEKWHHQQQIVEATIENSELLKSRYMRPYLETSMLAVPYHYKSVTADEGKSLSIEVSGLNFNSFWTIQSDGSLWKFVESNFKVNSQIKIPAHVIWKVFSKQIGFKEALNQVQISGDRLLAIHILKMVAVMA
tara:strand:- start:10249 stop:11079 length:831 start_codon:yes stop_codon:yes gene_type:complete